MKKVEQYVKSNRFIQLDASHVTTEQAKLEEEQLLNVVRDGWDTREPIGRAFELDVAKLTDEQRKALEHILASRDLVMNVSGIAGAGKSQAALHQSVMQPGERKSVWEFIQALRRSKPQSRDRMMPDLWAARQAEIVRGMEMER